jgi:hypothetical protein
MSLVLSVRSDFPSLDHLGSLQWGLVAQQAAAALAEGNAAFRVAITCLIALLSCGLGYIVLRSMITHAPAKQAENSNSGVGRSGTDVPAFCFALRESVGAKKDHGSSDIESREYELGIEFASGRTSTTEPEWKF